MATVWCKTADTCVKWNPASFHIKRCWAKTMCSWVLTAVPVKSLCSSLCRRCNPTNEKDEFNFNFEPTLESLTHFGCRQSVSSQNFWHAIVSHALQSLCAKSAVCDAVVLSSSTHWVLLCAKENCTFFHPILHSDQGSVGLRWNSTVLLQCKKWTQHKCTNFQK